MTLKEKWDEAVQRGKIVQVYSKKGLEPPKRLKFENTAMTDKGVALYYDELVQGAPVFQKDPAGMLVAAPAGEHMLEDGTMLTVEIVNEGGTDMSIIKEVVVAEAPAEETPVTPPADMGDSAASEAAAKTRIRSIIEEVRFSVDPELSFEDTVEALKEQIQILQNENTELKTSKEAFKKQSDEKDTEIKSMRDLLAKLEEEPADVTVKSKFRIGRVEDKNDWADRLKRSRKVNN